MSTKGQNENIVDLFFGENKAQSSKTGADKVAEALHDLNRHIATSLVPTEKLEETLKELDNATQPIFLPGNNKEEDSLIQKARSAMEGGFADVFSDFDEKTLAALKNVMFTLIDSIPVLIDGNENEIGSVIDSISEQIVEIINAYASNDPNPTSVMVELGNDIVDILLLTSTPLEKEDKKLLVQVSNKVSSVLAKLVVGEENNHTVQVENRVNEQLNEETPVIEQTEVNNQKKEIKEGQEPEQLALFDFGSYVLGDPKKKKVSDSKTKVPDKSSTPTSAKTGKPTVSGKSTSSKQTTTSSQTGVKPSSNRVQPRKHQNIKVEGDWTIHYATQFFRVSDIVNPMPASGQVSLEEIRAAMEREFFEMTKERVKWDYDTTKKRLFPDVSGASKGGM